MAAPLLLRVEQTVAFQIGDFIEIEVDGVVDAAKPRIWGQDREFIDTDPTPLPTVLIRTATEYDSGTYSVRLRAVDSLGQAGPWTAAQDVNHRTPPAPPTSLDVLGSELTWSYP